MNRRAKAREKISGMIHGDHVECLICGNEYKSVGNHVFMAHGMTAKQYKQKFGIPLEAGLLGDSTRALNIESSKSCFNEEKINKRIIDKYGSIDDYKLIKRNEFMPLILKSIEDKVSLYSLYKKTSVIIAFFDSHGTKKEKALLKKSLSYTTQQNPSVLTECKICGKEVKKFASQIKKNADTFCSHKCLTESKKNASIHNCEVCGKEMIQTPSQAARVKTCSKECSIKKKKARRKK